jgi:ABC-type uncharacterized transport system ATPase subunit
MLKLDKLTRRFGDNLAVNNANLVIPDGQMVGSSANPVPANRRCCGC